MTPVSSSIDQPDADLIEELRIRYVPQEQEENISGETPAIG
jgi:hypothetical protein